MAQSVQSGIILQQNLTYVRMLYYGTAGQVLTVNLSKAGAAFGPNGGGAGAIAEVANGWYKVLLSSNDTNTLGDLAYHVTGGAGGPLDFADQVQSQVFQQVLLDNNSRVSISSNIKQNQALNGFTFVMRAVGTNLPATGLAVTAQRSLGGAGFVACANGVAEVALGVYSINLAAADLNSPTVMLLFTAPGANSLYVPIILQP